ETPLNGPGTEHHTHHDECPDHGVNDCAVHAANIGNGCGESIQDHSQNSTVPSSTWYSAPTISNPSRAINRSSIADPWRSWRTDASTFARTARSYSACGSLAIGWPSSGSTDGRIRSTIARKLGDWFAWGWRSSSSVAATAPHCVCPSTTASLVPNRSAANSTLPTCEGA